MTSPARRTALAVLGAAALAAGWSQPTAGQDRSGQPSAAPPPRQRQIAPVMSHVHADWLVRPERQREEQPDRLVSALRIPRGSTVIDLGAGVGYFTWRLAKRVGPTGRVLAVEIQQPMLDMLAENLRRRGIENVDLILGTPSDPRLPENQADLALLVDVYHELAFPAATMERVRRSLKADGRLVVVEYRKEEAWIPIHPLHKMTVEEVRREIEPVGFELLEVLDFLPRQHVIVFVPRKN